MVTPDTKDNLASSNTQDMNMEDVLASIRKIIDSDNDTDADNYPVVAQTDEEKKAVAASSDVPDQSTANVEKDNVFVPPSHLFDKGGDEDEDLLELTREIQADGGEIDLRSQSQPTQPMLDSEVEDTSAIAGASTPMNSKPVTDYNLEDLYTQGLEEPVKEELSIKDPQDDNKKSNRADSSRESENSTAHHHKRTSTTSAHEHHKEAHFHDPLLSVQSSTASLEILKSLTNTIVHDEEKEDHSPSLEAVVLTALRPLLKAWVDKNLPDLISKIVREEIKELVERAKPK